MPRALSMLRSAPHYRRDAFNTGLRAAGFDLVPQLDNPERGDVLLIWNRYGAFDARAEQFERAGAMVLVAENCPLGNDLLGGSYSLAAHHIAACGGGIVEGGPERWDSWDVMVQPFRTGGTETVILGQRGIGHASIASPPMWAESTCLRIGGRIRAHPGTGPAKPLAEDLANARQVVTWNSAAALQALALGVPIWTEHARFIARSAGRTMSEWGAEPKRDWQARLAVFRRLAWAIWSLKEITDGEPIARLVNCR